MSLIIRAAQFAAHAHAGQTRKYNGAPYVTHPGRVAARAAVRPDATEELVAAAFLHDVLEDTPTGSGELRDLFGDKVAALVLELTAPSELVYKGREAEKPPRAVRKKADREHYAKASKEAKILKMLDRIDNLGEIDPKEKFARTYAAESVHLAEAIGDADRALKEELLKLAAKLLEGGK